MCDPPQGWMYGFPKEVPPDLKKTVHEWMVDEGYPEEKIKNYGEFFYVRYWYAE